MKKTIILIVVIIAIAASILYLQQPETIIEDDTGEEITLGTIGERVSADVGNTVQDFKLVDYEQKAHQLSDYRGKPIILNFWASWCPFCLEEMSLFETFYQDYRDRGLELIAVNRGESLQQAKKFTDPMDLSYTLLLNKSDDVYNSYNLQAMPTTFFIDDAGVIQDIKFGQLTEKELRGKIDELFTFSKLSEKPKRL